MAKTPQHRPAEWDLGEWEQALTISVGTAYVCRVCGNVVMVTRGGTGMMQLVCCGKPMERIERPAAKSGGAS